MRPILVVSEPACAPDAPPGAGADLAERAGAALRVVHSDGAALQRLAADASAPVLLARKPAPWPLGHVLVVLDPIDLATGMLRRVCAWLAELAGAGAAAAAPRTHLRVLHVSAGVREWRESAPAFEREVRGVEELAWSAGARVSRCVRWGAVPGRRIVETAASTGADLVVLSPKGPPTRPSAWRWVATRAPCNVLLFPGVEARPHDPGRGP